MKKQRDDSLRIFDNNNTLITELAEDILDLIQNKTRKGVFSLVLAGGSTPKKLYKLLSRKNIPWDKIHLFFSDERYMLQDSQDSNYHMVRESLISRIKIPDNNIHPIPTNKSNPQDAAKKYEDRLKIFFNSPLPKFDLTLLGIGEDCHTASLFPHSPILRERTRLVAVETNAPKSPRVRITLTFSAINQSRKIYFLVTGDSKARAVKRILIGDEPVESCPAKGVHPVSGKPTWWLDKAASKFLA